jgi:hypothetical protein
MMARTASFGQRGRKVLRTDRRSSLRRSRLPFSLRSHRARVSFAFLACPTKASRGRMCCKCTSTTSQSAFLGRHQRPRPQRATSPSKNPCLHRRRANCSPIALTCLTEPPDGNQNTGTPPQANAWRKRNTVMAIHGVPEPIRFDCRMSPARCTSAANWSSIPRRIARPLDDARAPPLPGNCRP